MYKICIIFQFLRYNAWLPHWHVLHILGIKACGCTCLQVNKPYLPVASGAFSMSTGITIVTASLLMVSWQAWSFMFWLYWQFDRLWTVWKLKNYALSNFLFQFGRTQTRTFSISLLRNKLKLHFQICTYFTFCKLCWRLFLSGWIFQFCKQLMFKLTQLSSSRVPVVVYIIYAFQNFLTSIFLVLFYRVLLWESFLNHHHFLLHF